MVEDRDNNGRKKEEVLSQVTSETGSLNTETVHETNRTRDRRGVLSSIGGILASLQLIPQSTRAHDSSKEWSSEAERLAEERRILKKYDTPEKARDAVQKHGSELVGVLAEEGLLNSSSVIDLNIPSLWNPAEFATSEEGAKVSGATVAGTPTAHIQVAKQIASRRVILIVQPEISRSYAIIKSQGSDSQLVTAANGSIEPVDYCVADDHCVANYCSSNPLVDDFTYREVYCCQSSPCYFGEDIGCCTSSTSSSCYSFC